MNIDINTVGIFLAIGMNILTALGVFIRLENRLTKLETSQELLFKLVDLRIHNKAD